MNIIQTRQQLINHARKAVSEAGSQTLAAKVLGITQQTVSDALNVDPEKATYDATLIRIIEKIGERSVKKAWIVE